MSGNNPPIQGDDPVGNRQAGRVLGEGDPAEHGVVASGDRREDVHFEADPDPDQKVVAHHLVRPAGPLPPQEHSAESPVADADHPPVEDVRVAPGGPSVWDARPPPEDADKSGHPTGH